MRGHKQKTAINQEADLTSIESAGALVLDFPATRTVRNKFLSLIGEPVYGTVTATPKI